MKAFLAIVGRELWRRGSVVSLALLIGCVFCGLVFSDPSMIVSPRYAGMSVVVLVSALLVAATALVGGWSMIAPEQAAGRLGFFFSRPVPTSSIWGAKLTAGVALPVAVGTLTLVPLLVMDPRQGPPVWTTASAGMRVFGVGAYVLFLVGLGNAASVAGRSRPRQRALDLLLLGAFLFLALKPSRLLTVAAWASGCSSQDGLALAPIALAPLGLALLVASAGQAWGRLEAGRSHALFSIAFWPLAFLTLCALAGIGHSMETASPSLLRRVDWAEGAPQGGWIFVSGPVRWGQYRAAFLYEPASGRYMPLGGGQLVSQLAFSSDGGVAAVVESNPLEPGRGRTRVVRLDAATPAAETVFSQLSSNVAVSRDYLIARRQDWSVVRYGLRDGSGVTSLLSGWPERLSFREDGLLRIGDLKSGWHYCFDPSDQLCHEREDPWDRLNLYLVTPAQLPARRQPDDRGGATPALDIEPYGTVFVGSGWENVDVREGPSPDRLLVRRSARSSRKPTSWRICLHETATGDHMRLLAGPGTADADFLSRGFGVPGRIQAGIAVADVREGRGSLRLLTADGAELAPKPWSEDLGPAVSVSLAGEPAPGYLFVGVRESVTGFGHTFVLGPSGSWNEAGIYPAAPRAEGEDSPGAGRPVAGSLGSRLFLSEQGTLVRYDPETRTRTVLLGRAGG